MSILASTIFSLSPDVRRYQYMNKHIGYENETEIESIIEDEIIVDLKSCYYLNNISGSYSEVIKNQLISFSNQTDDSDSDSKISFDVLNQSLNIIDSIYPSLIEKLNIDNIYSSSYGTVILDWELSNNSLFSLEVGKNAIGYFIEKNGDDVKEVDSLSLSEKNLKNTFSLLIKDLSDFI
jgi:hypothetical protein